MLRFCAFLIAATALAQTAQQPARAVTDPGVITTRQAITPAGVPSIFRGKVFGVTFGESSADVWVVTGTDIYRMDWKANRVVERVPLGGAAAMQGIRYDAERKRALAPSAVQPGRKIRLLSVQGGAARILADDLGTQLAGALAISANTAAVPLTKDNQLAVIDVESGAVKQKVK